MSLFIEEKQTRFLICDVINQRQKEWPAYSALGMHMLNQAELISMTIQNIITPFLEHKPFVFLTLSFCC